MSSSSSCSCVVLCCVDLRPRNVPNPDTLHKAIMLMFRCCLTLLLDCLLSAPISVSVSFGAEPLWRTGVC